MKFYKAYGVIQTSSLLDSQARGFEEVPKEANSAIETIINKKTIQTKIKRKPFSHLPGK